MKTREATAKWLFAAGPGAAILNVSSPGGQSYHFSSSYGAGKAGLLMERSGTIQWVEDLAEEFGIVDEHGKRPPGYPQRVAARR